jgi:tRNA nucleotidyltransferase (CCA-adding enzyme)
VQSVVTASIAAQAAAQGLQGAKVGERIHAARVRAVADWLGTASTH